MRRALAIPLAIFALVILGAVAAIGSALPTSDLHVSLKAKITPQVLPRLALAPVAVRVEESVWTGDGSSPPPLRQITIAVNRYGKLTNAGLPTCPAGRIKSTTTATALDRCKAALVGHGTIAANVVLPQISPFPAEGKILAFNGRLHGKTVILTHIYGGNPVPTTFVLPFTITHQASGTFGTTLSAKLPPIAGDWGYVKKIDLTIFRRYRAAGEERSFLSANCPIPNGFPATLFNFARGTYRFANGQTVSKTVTRVCRVRQ